MPKPLRHLFIALVLFGLGLALWTVIPRRPPAAGDGVAPQAVAPEIAPERSDAQHASRETVESMTEADEVRVRESSATAVATSAMLRT